MEIKKSNKWVGKPTTDKMLFYKEKGIDYLNQSPLFISSY